MTLEDIIKVKLYKEFYDMHKSLFDNGRKEYWDKCFPYVSRNFRIEYEKAKKSSKESTSNYANS